jgi:hypothetical protein
MEMLGFLLPFRGRINEDSDFFVFSPYSSFENQIAEFIIGEGQRTA